MKITRAFAALLGLAVLGVAQASVAMPNNHHATPANHKAMTGQHRAAMGSHHMAMPGHHRGSSTPGRRVPLIRQATAKFHNVVAAEAAGYVPFTDVNGVSCIAMRGMGGMGVHLVNPDLIANPAIRRTAPEAIVYAPSRNGTLHLAALEYLVDKKAWDKTHANAPHLFRGHPFSVTKAPNRYGLDTFYSQHVWAWKHNRAGMLAMWNPGVHCSRA